jgi:acetolactate synthase-1/2/3 large subunit
MADGSKATTLVHSALARALKEGGVEVMFGLIGDANLYMVDAFVREQEGRYISSANEAGATVMALGYAVVSGKVGVATVTHGPAVTNTLTGLVEGVKGQIPMVLVCGDTGTEDRDSLQNVPQRELIVATGAGFEQLRSPATLTRDVAMALRRARLERRPIALNVPVNYQWQEMTYEPAKIYVPDTSGLTPAGEEMDKAVGIVAAARRPIVLAGRGATSSPAKAAMLALAERIGAPLATTLRGKGLFAGESHDLGVFGTLSTPVATDAILAADTIIAFGASLTRFTASAGSFLAGKRVVQCNSEAADIGKWFAPDAGLVGDAAATANAMIGWLDEAEIPSSGWRDDALAERLAAYSPMDGLEDASTERTIDVRRALRRLGDAIPTDRIVVTDGGRFVGPPWQLLDVPAPESFVYTISYGSIGLGVSYAIGAAIAAPGRPVLLVCGDGGFMLGGLAEFNTAVRHGVDLIVAVCNDSSYGAEHIQFRSKNMDPGLSVFDWPDLAPVAYALGGEGATVRTKADLESAISALASRRGPVLIDLKLDPDHVPPIPR